MIRVIVVDNNCEVCRDIMGQLEESGMVVDTFTDPVEALTGFQMNLYDLAIVDVRMPALDGFELIKRFRACRPAVSTIMISSHYDNDDKMAEQVMHHYCDVALTKPVSLTNLAAIAKKLTSYPYPTDIEVDNSHLMSKY